ncbi:helix-turn-helix domain-containing protein [Kineosporia babensis]|uniref:Helix-turn-helix domain-containing protein n=1 Tax=Kineosporia babensis TaxID=499548 RepID=A0A9X1SUQ8_9ACTN|nr:helix-turn-helix domain-containing protein [Kineosporia babensis]
MTEDPVSPDPFIHRRRLRNQLRRAREAAQRTQREVVQAMDWSISKLIRIESGSVRVSTNDLRMLLSFYGVEASRAEEIMEVSRAARGPTPWAAWRGEATSEYLNFVGLESSAAIIRNFEPTLVPGLLQTEEYARAVLQVIDPKGRIDSLVDLRMQRQELLVRPNPPKLHFIIDEAIVRRQVGGVPLMRRQLRRIMEAAQEEHVTVRVVTFDRGLYPHMRAPYVIFEFEADEDENVLYLEHPGGQMIISESDAEERGPSTPLTYLNHFWEIEQIAPRENTLEILDLAINALG